MFPRRVVSGYGFAVISVKAGHCLFGSFPNIARNGRYEDKKPLDIDGSALKTNDAVKNAQTCVKKEKI